MTTTSGPSAVTISDNLIMARPATAPLRRIVQAPFTRRTWSELAYTVVSALLAVCALVFIVPTLANGLLWGLSAPGVRKFGTRSRHLARELLGEVVADPPPPRPALYFRVRTPEAGRLAVAALGAGGRARVWDNQQGLSIRKLSPARIAELAAGEGIGIGEIQPMTAALRWLAPRMSDPVAWRARAYYAIKVPLGGLSLAVAGVFWLGGLFFLTFPVSRALGAPSPSLSCSLLLIPAGAVKLLAVPWLVRGATVPTGGSSAPYSAQFARRADPRPGREPGARRGRFRGPAPQIERDLHDGTQAQLVALAMKLSLAQEKLRETAPVDLARITQLVDDAHHRTIEAIVEVRTLARGIHPVILDNGLADALITLATRSAVPVELVTDIPERPSEAIETIAYFCASELLTNVAKHSGARHATLEAVRVPGLLRIRVTDDGRGGASPAPGGGLYGLAERARAVDGHIDVHSPAGGPTAITVELPSRA